LICYSLLRFLKADISGKFEISFPAAADYADHLDNKNPFPIGLRSENPRLFRLPTRWLLS